MRYFKAFEKKNKPFLKWELWANDEAELKLIGDKEINLIIPETDIPEFSFGVSPLKIVEGELVKRSDEEMKKFEFEFLQEQNTRTFVGLRNELKTLFYEIQFTDSIKEDSTDLKIQYEVKFREYNALNNPE